MTVIVTKKNGTNEQFNNEKIKKAINWACQGLDVNPLALEAKFDEFLYNGITTTKIQANLIEHAKSLASASDSDWVFVAGRLMTMNMWSYLRHDSIPYAEYVRGVQKGVWVHPALDVYTDAELNEAGSYIVQDRDLDHSFASVITAQEKYLMENETIQDMFMGNALILASVEKPSERLKWVKTIYDVLSKRWISLATPFLSNLRANRNIASCFILQPDDDIHSIYDALKDAALISKAGGGLGLSLSRCRGLGSDLMGNKEKATGIIGWAKLFNDTAVFVNQGGKRKGAFTVELSAWHIDIQSFLELQTEVGDQRKKAHDIKLQVGLHDHFMKLKDDKKAIWYTFCPHEVESVLGIKLYAVYGEHFVNAYNTCVKAYKDGVLKVVKEVGANALYKKILKTQFETGLPYIGFLDTMNKYNPNPHIGNIPCGNLCTESFSVVIPDKLHHTCNLASLVAGRVPLEKVPEIAGIAVHILDNGITLTNPPVEESRAHNELLRTVGVGVQGYHDLLARECVSFLDADFASRYAEMIQYGCLLESIELAKSRGAYPAFKGSRWDDGFLVSEYKRKSISDLNWDYIQEQIDLYGVRCSQHTSPAPNTSSSIFMDAGAGVMPVYGGFFYEDNQNGVMPVASMYLKENPLSYSRDISTYKPYQIPKIIGRMQQFFDTGISAEYLMNKNDENLTAKYLHDTVQNAWEEETKMIYYIRTIKKGETLVKSGEDCASCSG